MSCQPNRLAGAHAGFTLVELLVAVALGSLLMLGAMSVFISTRESHEVNTANARLQDNARYAIDQITADLRMAGFFGCADDASVVSNSLGTGGILWDTDNPLEGFNDAAGDGSDTWSISTRAVSTKGLPGPILAGTDGITVRYLAGMESDGAGGVANEVTASTNDSVTITPGLAAKLDVEDALIGGVADCGGADIFEIDDIVVDTSTDPDTYSGEVEAKAAFSRAYDAGTSTYASTLVARRYFIANNADVTPNNPNGVPSLWVVDLDGDDMDINSTPPKEPAAQEVITGVQDLQILYGLDTDNDVAPNQYAAAGEAGVLDSAAAWSRVVTVRFSLLVRTDDPLGSEDRAGKAFRVLSKTYTTPTGSSTANKLERRHRRRVFTATANVRNIQ